jgi:predicted ester cyclase
MAESAKKQVYRRFVEEVINQGKIDVIPELFHPEYMDHSAPPGADHSGSVYEQVAAIPKLFRGAFPDVKFTIESMVEDGDWVATRVTGRAQHIGRPFMGIDPSGWKIAWSSEGFFRMKDNKIVEHWGQPDMLGLYEQVNAKPEPGSLDEARAIVARYVYHVNMQDYDDFDKYVVPDYVDHDPIPGQQPGREGLKNAYRGFSDAFPDIWFTFEDLVAEGDMVVGRGVIEGTHTGHFLQLPPTNKKIKWTGTRMFRVRDGKVSEGWINFDLISVFQQMGVMQTP